MTLQPYEQDPDWWKPRRDPTEREREIHVAAKVVLNRFKRSMDRFIQDLRRTEEAVRALAKTFRDLKEQDDHRGPHAR